MLPCPAFNRDVGGLSSGLLLVQSSLPASIFNLYLLFLLCSFLFYRALSEKKMKKRKYIGLSTKYIIIENTQ